jgi:hypothetical protein
VIAAILVLVVQRATVPVVVLSLAALIPSAQRISVAGADFTFVRFLVLVAFARFLFMGETRWLRWNWIDTCVTFGALARLVCWSVTKGTTEDFVGAVGLNLELLLSYLVVRCSVRSLDDLRILACTAAILCVLVVPFFLIERQTGRNMFSVFGGIPEVTPMREGKIRCRGAFSHAILAGCFFVAWMPIWIGLALKGRQLERVVAVSGFLAAFLIVFACASSTPVVALILGIGVWIFFPARAHLRLLWMSGLAFAVVLNFLMEKGIWHLIARIDLVGGSTGYHRYHLIDKAIKHFGEWWMLGTSSTAHWGYGLFDVTNQFVLEGVRGGVWALLAIILVFILSYAAIGRELRGLAARISQARALGMPRVASACMADEYLVYALGATMCAQMAIFLAVSYFGETTVIWQFFMGLCAAFLQWTSDPSRARSQVPSRRRPSVVGATVARPRDGRRDVEPLPMFQGGGS